MTTPILSAGPVRFTNSTTGQFNLLPLLDFSYDSSGAIQGSGAVYLANKKALDAWLNEMASDGVIQPNTNPPPNSAMTITAQQSGSTGNDIVITFANPRPDPSTPTNTIYNVTLEEVDTYQLTLADLESVLGTTPGGGSQPGLVHVVANASPGLPKAGSWPLALSGGVYEFKLLQADDTTEAFTVEARGAGGDGGQHIKVEVQSPNVSQGSFTLLVSFKKSVTISTPGDLTKDLEGVGYVVKAAELGGGTLLGIPVPGRIALRGGKDDATTPVAATALVGANL